MAFTFIGTIIGAGFASGQEIRKYFVDFGIYGLFGLIIVTLLFIVIGEKLMLLGYAAKSDSYDKALGYAFRCKFKKVIDYILCVFLIATTSTMFSGTGAFFNQVFSWPLAIGSLLMAVLTGIITIVGISGIMKISTFIVPALIFITSIIAFSSTSGVDITKISLINEISTNNFISASVSGVIYAAYNLILGMPVLITLGSVAKNKKQIRINSIFAGIVIGIFGFIIYSALFMNYSTIYGTEIPILILTSNSGFFWYGISFIIAVLTTSVGSLFGVYTRFNKNKRVFLLITTFAYFFSLFGFSNLVANLYFVMGLFGIFIISMLLYGASKSSVLRKVK